MNLDRMKIWKGWQGNRGGDNSRTEDSFYQGSQPSATRRNNVTQHISSCKWFAIIEMLSAYRKLNWNNFSVAAVKYGVESHKCHYGFTHCSKDVLPRSLGSHFQIKCGNFKGNWGFYGTLLSQWTRSVQSSENRFGPLDGYCNPKCVYALSLFIFMDQKKKRLSVGEMNRVYLIPSK